MLALWGSEHSKAGLLWAEREQLDGAFSFCPAAQERTGGAGLARGPSPHFPSGSDSLWQALAGGHACRPCGFPAWNGRGVLGWEPKAVRALPVGHGSYPGRPCPSPCGRERQGSQPWSPCPTQATQGSKLRTFKEDFSMGVQVGCSSGDSPPSAFWRLGCPRLHSQDLNLANGCHNLALLHQATCRGPRG